MNIPQEVTSVITILEDAGHSAFIVGGCVRDLLRGASPKDWDVTTAATPEEIQALFPESFYENKFLTVTVKTDSENPALKEVEVTTFRAEGKYTDQRHPDEVRFAKTLEEDLSRRDFTMNAIALSVAQKADEELVDPFQGAADIEQKIIRAVGNPAERFGEDALRMLRAVRFAAELGFDIEPETRAAIEAAQDGLRLIAKDRIRDELIKLIASPRAKEGIELLHELGLLAHIIPELEEGIGVENRPNVFSIWEHNLKSLEYGASQNFSVEVRLAALLHDAGKPRTKGPKKNDEWTFYGHDVVGGRMAAQILSRLHFPQKVVEKISILVRWHLFKYEMDETDRASNDPAQAGGAGQATTDSSIRRLVRRVGAENMEDLVKLRMCDRMGMGVPKALPYRLRHFQFRVEKIIREEEAPTAKMLKIDGNDVMKRVAIEPGPKVGRIIEVLLQEVIDEPACNVRDTLLERAQALGGLSDEELERIAEEAETKVEMVEDERVSKMKGKYWVK